MRSTLSTERILKALTQPQEEGSRSDVMYMWRRRHAVPHECEVTNWKGLELILGLLNAPSELRNVI